TFARMKFTAEQIANLLNGSVEGDPGTEVYKLAKIEVVTSVFLTFLINSKYTSYIYSTNSSVIIDNENFKAEEEIGTTLIRVKDPYKAFSTLLEYYNEVKLNISGIEEPNFISDTASFGENIYLGAFTYLGKNVKIGKDVKIYPHCYIGDNVSIGDNSVIFSGVKIYSETVIGNSCILHSGVVLGADGFGFSPGEAGGYSKVPQIGNVVLGNNVDIGAGTTIDRATLGSTIIRDGVKLD